MFNIVSAVAGAVGAAQKNANIDRQIKAQQQESAATREWNLNLAKTQNQWNVEQWNRENTYNSPSAQMARFRDAGLNSDLMYGQENLSAASPQLTSGDGSTPTDLSNLANKSTIGDIMSQSAQNRLVNAQAKLAESQANKTDKETDAQGITNEWLPKLLKGDVDVKEADIKQKLSAAGLNDKQVEVATQQILSMQQSVKESQESINMLQKQMENITFEQVQRMLDYNLRKDKQAYEVREILSKIGLNSVTARRVASLLPYEIAESISRTNLNDSSAALNFLKQGTEMIIRQNLRLDKAQKSEMLKALQYDNYEKLMELSAHLDKDGNEHFISKCFRALKDMIDSVSPLK